MNCTIYCNVNCTWLPTPKGIESSLQYSVQYSTQYSVQYTIHEEGREVFLSECASFVSYLDVCVQYSVHCSIQYSVQFSVQCSF